MEWTAGLLLAFAVSFALVFVVRKYALAKDIIDIPNHRSSHLQPTPRGGGIAFVVVFVLSLLVMGVRGMLPSVLSAGMTASLVLVASTGFVDDWRGLSPKTRLLLHMLAATPGLWAIGGVPSLSFAGFMIPSGVWLTGFGLLFLVWYLNLFNFMDGIDGIAAVETITIALSGSLLFALSHHADGAMMPLFLVASVLGFLCWNFPRARIFMGDAGSGFLGLTLGLLTLLAGHTAPELFWGWLIFAGVFVVDATTTLLVRLFRRRNVFDAHRTHAYQHAARQSSHQSVVALVFILNSMWLLPLGLLAGLGKLDGFLALVIAWLPLVLLALVLGAGTAETELCGEKNGIKGVS
ncbi:alpha-N-acetylglucosaminyltransferase [Legionella geestiana]|uniref:Alpha-N-acetylglucosaminyltransferase n=1 Tax=Legionella geestiana TaxID=45065 RepID=A0A0W0TY24_9GAMM|nr:glycosyltransferase family 4 protein [Legionella geestiana]KTD00643.1 alpha-N-acetylglucosaminyltransferase [Legionella geestiana]QBS11742.1 glycosyltransferase family 4 protein [Legionella geestiana]STX53567.1 UDP-N-acetylmuramyl pentapeptide phosphotransferase/UDP-N- acetylglucosamine-1-phosphate transferase [Legionella geestiana]